MLMSRYVPRPTMLPPSVFSAGTGLLPAPINGEYPTGGCRPTYSP